MIVQRCEVAKLLRLSVLYWYGILLHVLTVYYEPLLSLYTKYELSHSM